MAGPAQLTADAAAQGVGRIRLAMGDEGLARLAREASHPGQDLAGVGVRGELVELHGLGPHRDVLAEDANRPGAADDRRAPRAAGLEARERILGDAEFADDLETALRSAGYEPAAAPRPRASVAAFAIEMERELRANAHKGNRHGWRRDHPSDLLEHLTEEVGEVGVRVLQAVKDCLDPAGILNPGKLIP